MSVQYSIEKTAAQLFGEAAKDGGAFEGRSVRSLQRVGTKLKAWNSDGKQAAVLRRLQTQLGGVCAKVDVADGRSGVKGLELVLGGVDQLEFVYLSSADVVRHKIVADIVEAYERDAEHKAEADDQRSERKRRASADG